MATLIPRAPLPETRVAPIPQAQQTARLDMSGVNAGIQRLGGQAAAYFDQQLQMADEAALMEARSALSTWEGAINDPANPNGRFKYQGKHALAAGESLLPQADAEISRIRQNLAPRQQRQFDAIATNFRAQFHEGLNRWSSQQFAGYEDATYKATVENLTQDAVHAGLTGDFTRQASIGNELLLMNRQHLTTRGMGEELIKASERGLASTIHAATLDGMLTTDPIGAQAYYQRFADQMQPGDRAKVERALYPIVEDMAADGYADAILGGQDVQADDPESIDAAIVQLESGGVDTAQAGTSSATGAGQFIDSTWLQVVRRHRPDVAAGKTEAEILALRTDGALSREMVAAYRRDNTAHLQAHGVQTTAANVYAAHHFGPAGGVKFGQASADTPMSSILTAGQIKANPYLQGKTKGEAIAQWQRRGLPADGAPQLGEVAAGPPASEADAVARARQIRDPRLRQAVVRKVSERYRLQALERREAEVAMSEHVYTSIETAENPNRPLRELIGPEAYAWAVREGKVDALDSMRLRKVQGTFVQDDPAMVEALTRESVLSPATFKDRNLYEVADRLSTSTLQDLLKRQADAGRPEKQAEWATEAQRIDRGFVMLGLDQAPTAKAAKAEHEALRGEFRLAYQNAERDFVQRTGKKPDPAQADALLASTARIFAQRQAEGRAGIYSRGARFDLQTSPAQRQQVRDAYRAKYGTDPTESYVTQFLATAAEAQTGG